MITRKFIRPLNPCFLFLFFRQPEYFFIKSALHGKVMDIWENNPDEGAKVTMFPKKDTEDDNQMWYEDRYGYIRSRLNDMVLDGSGTDKKSELIG